MSIDPPAKIIIIGAGPVGLETALYARYLGYEVEVLERGEVCQNVLRWGHVRMFSPFHMNCSTLGLAALKAQDPNYQPPAPDEILTGEEWARRYLIPLSQTDLLADHIRTDVDVSDISRLRYSKRDLPGDPLRGKDDFAVRYIEFESDRTDDDLDEDDVYFGDDDDDVQAVSRFSTAKVVIDCSGNYGAPNPCGVNEIDEISFLDEAEQVVYGIPDLEDTGPLYEGGHTLVIGNGYSAATTVVALAGLAETSPGTKITWLTRTPTRADQGPITRIENDRLPQRDELARRANELATAANAPVEWWSGANVTSIRINFEDTLRVEYQQRVAPPAPDSDDEIEWEENELEVDRVVANVGYQPSIHLFRELQVHLCYATEGPMKLASALLAASGTAIDCLDQSTGGVANLITTEPNFYILGSKSYGRNSSFLFQHGLDQVRDLFTMIGGRDTLDLYRSVKDLA